MSERSYYDGQPHYDRETVRFFDVAHEGAQFRAVAQAADSLGHLSQTAPRSVVIVATDQIAEAAARCAVTLAGPARYPVVVVRQLPHYVGPLDVVLVVGDAPDAEAVVGDLATAAGRGAETILAGPQTGPVPEDAPADTVIIAGPPTARGSSPMRTIAAVQAVLAALSGQVAVLDGVAEDIDYELSQLSPERDVTVNAARQLREFVQGARIVHTGYSVAGAAVAQLVAALWSTRGLPGGFVSREELATTLEDAQTAGGADPNDIFHDPFIDGEAEALPVKVIVWGETNARLVGGRAEAVEGEETTAAHRLIVRALAATALQD